MGDGGPGPGLEDGIRPSDIAEGTAGVHVSNIIGKLGVQGRAGAAAIGVRLGLVSDAGGTHG